MGTHMSKRRLYTGSSIIPVGKRAKKLWLMPHVPQQSKFVETSSDQLHKDVLEATQVHCRHNEQVRLANIEAREIVEEQE